MVAEVAKPNGIVVLADDLGVVDLGCYGSTDLETPQVDGLTERGVRFTPFYSVAPVCSPSWAGLLTCHRQAGLGPNAEWAVREGDWKLIGEIEQRKTQMWLIACGPCMNAAWWSRIELKNGAVSAPAWFSHAHPFQLPKPSTWLSVL